MHPIAFKLGTLSVHWYGVLVALGFIAGLWTAGRRAALQGLSPEKVGDSGPWMIVGGIIGARLLYVTTYWQESFAAHPWTEVFMVQRGGLVFYGGLVGASVATIFYCRVRRMALWKLADVLAPSIALGYVFGRLGCLMNGCCYGRACSLPWAIRYPSGALPPEHESAVHPTQIYDSLLSLALYLFLAWLFRRKKFEGQVFAAYLIGYACTRSFVEYFRGDYNPAHTHAGFLTPAQLVSAGILVAGVALMVMLKRPNPQSPIPNKLQAPNSKCRDTLLWRGSWIMDFGPLGFVWNLGFGIWNFARNALMPASPPIFLVGPTASGKSAVALALAEKRGGEIISVDSMQVYRGLDIGTAKPSAAERARVPHHLIDVVELTEAFDAAKFVEQARRAEQGIRARGRTPIFCGGTGLYLKALLEGLGDAPPSDSALRRALEATPLEELLRELEQRDPVTYERIDRQNPRRVIRALEVIRLTGKPFSAQRATWSSSSTLNSQPLTLFGLKRTAADLHARINARVEEMFARGLVEETQRLLAMGLERNPTAMQAIGYRQVVEHLSGARSLAETVELVKIKTRQFAKRQMTWFRRQLAVNWLSVEAHEDAAQVAERIPLA